MRSTASNVYVEEVIESNGIFDMFPDATAMEVFNIKTRYTLTYVGELKLLV